MKLLVLLSAFLFIVSCNKKSQNNPGQIIVPAHQKAVHIDNEGFVPTTIFNTQSESFSYQLKPDLTTSKLSRITLNL